MLLKLYSVACRVSFVLKIPFFLLGLVGFIVLATSGDYKSVDLTKPETLLHPDATRSLFCSFQPVTKGFCRDLRSLLGLCALSEMKIDLAGQVWLWTMELLHYISAARLRDAD